VAATAPSLANLHLIEPLRWRIETLLERNGILVVGGPPKRGKSRLVLSMLLDAAVGEPVLGQFRPMGRLGALIYNAEGGVHGMKARQEMWADIDRTKLTEVRVTDRRPKLLTVFGRFAASALEEEVALWRRIRDSGGQLDIVVLDPLIAFHCADENNNAAMHLLLDRLRDAAEKEDVALIVVHHEAKPGELPKQGGLRLRGASAIHGAVDNVLLLGHNGRIEFEFKHSPPCEPMQLRQRGARFVLVPIGDGAKEAGNAAR
jgi:RecA-family ATPase